jgi:haloacetate dehalogenase
VAPRRAALAERFTVVLLDLRGYGDSGRPAAGEGTRNYSKREMALDALHVMRHARARALPGAGARPRRARGAPAGADHPQAVERMLLLDIAPTLAMYRNTSEAFARAYWHWFFLIQPPPLPEALIASDPVRYVRSVMGARHAGLAPSRRRRWPNTSAARHPGTAESICADYRASAGIDLQHDQPTRTPAASSPAAARAVGRARRRRPQLRRARAVARRAAPTVTGRSLPCGHYIAEEAPGPSAGRSTLIFQEQP